MYFKCNGMSWVGDIYQKIKAMCSEVDEIMYQNSINGHEDQVQTVGASVKKICSNGIQDLLPSSAGGPVKGASLDLSLEQNAADARPCKISKRSVEEEPKKANIEQLPENVMTVNASVKSKASPASSFSGRCNINNIFSSCSVDPNEDGPSEPSNVITPMGKDTREGGFINKKSELTCDMLDKMSSPTSDEVRGCGSAKNAMKLHDNPVNAIRVVAGISSTLPCSDLMVLPVVFCENKVPDSEATSYINTLAVRRSSGADTSTTSARVYPVGSSGNKIWQDSKPSKLDAFMSTAEIGRSDECCSEEARKYGFVEPEPDRRTCEPFDKVKLEESCVIVDSEELRFAFNRADKHRSYTKKIRDVFSSKMAKKQQYDQLAILYGDVDTVSNQQRMESSAPSLLTRGRTTPDIGESEWELL